MTDDHRAVYRRDGGAGLPSLASRAAPVDAEHTSAVDRHAVFVALSQPFAPEPIVAAEVYRVRIRLSLWTQVMVVVFLIGVAIAAALSGAYAVFNRLTIGVVFALVFGSVMLGRRRRGEPNLVIVGIGSGSLVLLRASFARARWEVLDEIGRWPTEAVGTQPGHDVLALTLTPPGHAAIELTPVAVSGDAAAIAKALGL